MPFGKFTKHFDYRAPKKASNMTSYPSGYEGDIPQAHYDAALEQGALDVSAKPSAGEAEGQGGKPAK